MPLTDRTTASAVGRFSGSGPYDLRPLRGTATNARAQIDALNDGAAYSLPRATDTTFPLHYEWWFTAPTQLEVVFATGTVGYRETSTWTDVEVQAFLADTWSTLAHWTRPTPRVLYGAGGYPHDLDNGGYRDIGLLPPGFLVAITPTVATHWRIQVNATTNGFAPDDSVLATAMPSGLPFSSYDTYGNAYDPTPHFDLARLVGAGSVEPVDVDAVKYLVADA